MATPFQSSLIYLLCSVLPRDLSVSSFFIWLIWFSSCCVFCMYLYLFT